MPDFGEILLKCRAAQNVIHIQLHSDLCQAVGVDHTGADIDYGFYVLWDQFRLSGRNRN